MDLLRFKPERNLWRMPAAGGEETRVLDSVPWWRNFQVVEDGVYFTAAGTPPSIQFLRFATGRIERVAVSHKRFATGIGGSPDGRTILFSVLEQQGQDLMLVQNFR